MTSATTSSHGNVLAVLDARAPTSFYWSLTLLATIGGFLFGFDTSNIGSALDFVPYHLSGFALGYLVAGASLGAAAGALLAGPLTDRFGRKSLMIADAAIYAIGAILSAVTPDATVLLISRTLIGLAIGADSAIATAYIAEYAPRQRRGALAMLQQWMITVGILLAYVIAIIILKLMPGHTGELDWRLILGIGALPALIGVVLRARMPESPRWLLRKNRYEDVRTAMGKLGIEVSMDDVQRTAHALHEADANASRSGRRVWTAGVRRALFVVCVFFAFQQLTGINVPLYYGPHLLGPLFQGGDTSQVAATTAGVEVTAIMTVVNVAATYVAFRYIDRIGRRPLAIGGYLGMMVFALVAAAGLTFFTGNARIVVIMIGLCAFIGSFAIGVGGTGWLIQGEAFPTQVRGQAASIGATVDWLANFLVIELFPVAQSGVGLGWVLVGFAVLAVFALAFVVKFLPETKGHSVEEITEIFERQAQRIPVGATT
ncbi:sugar porter family MFS transporter [Actinoplanes sp. TBRC 11911]|uniref:sugar porter family MFS transporter n=1 Tax=Actinoplanes sp. TBRC 11911 TaxID=2729386 RepID=UPI00145CC539|nr:sugar porter family MFS transporter [Actinoplanes sp. TBRC 11911]NMO53899.1 sugar porter family MFS transporter [Actinoplanes sp. TBRC 11911]